jgi:hypothetical protein
MKKSVLIFMTIFAFGSIKAQNSKAYLGVSVGYAIPGGDGSENLNSGINLGFINFGYRFSKTWGATLNLTSSGFAYKNVGSLGVAVFSVGPMYTASLSDKLSLDLKPQYAISIVGKEKGTGYDDATLKGTGFVFGSSLNFGVTKGFKLSLNLDYTTGKWNELDMGGNTYKVTTKNSVSSLVMGAGLRYNF